MSELLLLLGQRTWVQLLSEQTRMRAVRDYSEVIRKSAQALRLVADNWDAYAYYRVGEELDLDWDFSDPEKTCDLAHWLDHIACAVPTFQRRRAFLWEQSPCRAGRSKQRPRANGAAAPRCLGLSPTPGRPFAQLC